MKFYEKVVEFIELTFGDSAVLKKDHDFSSADIYLDCLKDDAYEIVIDLRKDKMRAGLIQKNLELGDLSSFEYIFSTYQEAICFLEKCKNTGEFPSSLDS